MDAFDRRLARRSYSQLSTAYSIHRIMGNIIYYYDPCPNQKTKEHRTSGCWVPATRCRVPRPVTLCQRDGEMTDSIQTGASKFQQHQDALQAQVRRSARRRFLTRLVAYPLIFVLCNGSFFLLAWLVGMLQVLEHAEGFLATIRHGILVVTYCAYIFGFGVLCIKAARKLGIPWLFSNY